MASSLKPFFKAIANSRTEVELRSTLMDQLPRYFEMQCWGIYLLDANKRLASVDTVGVSDTFVEQYESIGRSVDKVLDYVIEHHVPTHEAIVFPAGHWKQSDLFQRCCSENRHEHIMTGPIVGQGDLIGTIHFAKQTETPAFTTFDLNRLGAICTHVSACLGQIKRPSSPYLNRLTPREIQIVNLVAQGLTNREIGAELWITQNSVKQALKRIYRKLEVSKRAEMVAKVGAH